MARVISRVVTGRPLRGFCLRTVLEASSSLPRDCFLARRIARSAGVSFSILSDAINTRFGSSPSFFGIGELGGGYSSGGKNTQTTTSSFQETVDLTKLASRQDLLVGFFGGQAVGSGVTNVTLDVYADGTDYHQSFATAAAAAAFFTDNAVDLGSLASGPLGANTLSLNVVLSVTTKQAGSGFYGSLIVGDPPPSHASAAGLAHAMASLAGTSGPLEIATAQGFGRSVASLARPSL